MARRDPLRSLLARLRVLLRFALVATGAGRLATAAVAACVLAYGLDRSLGLPLAGRAALLAGGLIAGLFLTVRWLLRPLVQGLSDEALILEVEQRGIGPDGLLSTALSVSGAPVPSPLGAGVLDAAQVTCRRLAALRMIRWRVPCVWGLAGLLALAAAAGVTAVRARPVATFFQRNLLLREIAWPRRTRLVVTSAPRFVVSGQSASVRVQALGRLPHSVQVMTRQVPGGDWSAAPMVGSGEGAFSADVGPLHRHAVVRIAGGDALPVERLLPVVQRPRVTDARMVVTPPAYVSDRPAELAWQAGRFDVPEGSGVLVRLGASAPLKSAAARTAGGETLGVEWLGPDRTCLTLALDVVGDTVLSVELTDERGVRSAEPFRVSIRAVPDEPPDVRMAVQGIGELVTPVARLPVVVEARDDYGLGEISLLARTDGEGDHERRLPVADGSGRQSVRGDLVVAVSHLGARAGGRVLLRATAADTATPDGPQFGQSAEVGFRVVGTAELLNSLLLMQLDLRRDLEHQIGLQRAILDLAARGEAEAAGVAARERELQPVLGRIAEGYSNVLAQMLHNGILDVGSHRLRNAAIPARLERLARPGGALESAAEALLAPAGAGGAPGIMREALAELERVRAAMMLLEGYASIVASVQEVAAEQEEILRRTEGQEGSVLERVFGP